ncbi:MAG: SIMPL domain-containing protein [Telluria sp.]|nr:SIMPL domain-containing protein [Telluria sp.]
MSLSKMIALAGLLMAAQVHAQTSLPTGGTLVIVPAYGEVTHVNDEAVVTFMVEEYDKDKAAAASRVNQKMKQGAEIVRREDPQAILKTLGYFTYPVYPEDRPMPSGMPAKPRLPDGWRVGQYLEVKTSNLNALPKMTAATQALLGLNGLHFRLKPATVRLLDEQRIAATYRNLNERIASIAGAMGRKVSDAVLDTVDFEGSGNHARPQGNMAETRMAASASRNREVAEPSFEPGETTLQMRLVGKVKFK